MMRDYKKEFKSVSAEDLAEEGSSEQQETIKKAEENKDLLAFIKESLGDQVTEVKLSPRLKKFSSLPDHQGRHFPGNGKSSERHADRPAGQGGADFGNQSGPRSHEDAAGGLCCRRRRQRKGEDLREPALQSVPAHLRTVRRRPCQIQ